MRTLRLGLLLLFAACGDSGIPARFDLGGDGAAPADLAGADLAGVDLAAAPADLAGAPDAAPRVGVACGTAWCDTASGNACCEIAQTCMPPPCGQGEQTDACDGPEDCPGQVCCLFVDPFFGTACTATCSQTGGS